MNTAQMRAELERKYSKQFVASKSDDQIQAIYLALKRKNKI
jgi:hypothetical protein